MSGSLMRACPSPASSRHRQPRVHPGRGAPFLPPTPLAHAAACELASDELERGVLDAAAAESGVPPRPWEGPAEGLRCEVEDAGADGPSDEERRERFALALSLSASSSCSAPGARV